MPEEAQNSQFSDTQQLSLRAIYLDISNMEAPQLRDYIMRLVKLAFAKDNLFTEVLRKDLTSRAQDILTSAQETPDDND